MTEQMSNLLTEIDETLAWIGECRHELQVAETRLAELQRRRAQLENEASA